MALYRSNINIGAALCFPWWWGRGRCGSPRIDRISRCISLRSWLFSRRWIKLEWNSLSKLKFVKAVSARTQQLHTTSKAGARGSKSGAMVRVVRNCALFCSPKLLWKPNFKQLVFNIQSHGRSLMLREVLRKVTSIRSEGHLIDPLARLIASSLFIRNLRATISLCGCPRGGCSPAQVARRRCATGRSSRRGSGGRRRVCCGFFKWRRSAVGPV